MKRVIYTYCLAILCSTLLSAQDHVVEVSQRSETHDTLVSTVDSVSVPVEIPATVSDDLSSQELVSPTSDCVKLDRIRGTYYLGDDPLTRKEYRDFLRVNAPDLYKRYRTGNALWWTGLACHILGVSALTIGILTLLKTAVYGFVDLFVIILSGSPSGEYDYDTYAPLGVWMTFGGGLLTAASAPCIAVGSVYKFNVHNVYNERCERQETTLELSIQTSQNGLGLALRF